MPTLPRTWAQVPAAPSTTLLKMSHTVRRKRGDGRGNSGGNVGGGETGERWGGGGES